ncbi:hypothetical protein [Rhizobium laguerreae]|nr:hypothetical protein [Rhizobium laguerreae]
MPPLSIEGTLTNFYDNAVEFAAWSIVIRASEREAFDPEPAI